MTDRIALIPEQAKDLIQKYGSPLYVYDEAIIRERCREVRSLSSYSRFIPVYSAKANTNIELLKLIKSEGFYVDAISPGEILTEEAAGFGPQEILFVSNNISVEEMQFAADRGIMVSLDSVSQLEQYGKATLQAALPPKVAFRLNPGIGTGHNTKVITGGKSKFGIEKKDVSQVQAVAAQFGLTIAGINQHIGSLFLQSDEYLAAGEILFETALAFPDLEFIDLGGGLGVPYRGEPRLNMQTLAQGLSERITHFMNKYPHAVNIMVESGRYVSAESGILLGTVHSIKENYGETYIGTDIGFNVLMRPVLYDAWHDIRIFTVNASQETTKKLTFTGNICESGDILAKDRELPLPCLGDIIGIENTGAYGYAMASNYNSRLRPAEVLIGLDGRDRLIRRRDTYEYMVRQL